MMTDAFGMESDASLEVQEKKARYIELRDKKKLTDEEKSEFEELKKFLSSVPEGGRANLALQEEHAKLLRDIQKELQERKG
jgi:hypothetical protein